MKNTNLTKTFFLFKFLLFLIKIIRIFLLKYTFKNKKVLVKFYLNRFKFVIYR